MLRVLVQWDVSKDHGSKAVAETGWEWQGRCKLGLWLVASQGEGR